MQLERLVGEHPLVDAVCAFMIRFWPCAADPQMICLVGSFAR